jgi:hypothetical protein
MEPTAENGRFNTLSFDLAFGQHYYKILAGFKMEELQVIRHHHTIF